VVPRRAIEVSCNGAWHQRWNKFLPQKFYDIHEREADHSFHLDLPISRRT